jgi:hypothetical protein
MNARGSRVTRVTLDADRTIASGESITVFGFIVANSTQNAAEVNITDGTAVTKQITVTVPAQDSRTFDIEFVSDDGITIDSLGNENVIVTVFHSQGGS